MGDYLQNIILRSLSLAEVVQPRVPQLFEQSSASVPMPNSSSQTEIVQTTPIVAATISEVPQTMLREVRRSSESEETPPSVTDTKDRDHHLPFTVRPSGTSPVVREDLTPARLIPTMLDSGPVPNPVSPRRAELEPQPQSEREQVATGPRWREPSIAMIDQNPPALTNARLQPSVPKRSLPSLAQNLSAELQQLPIKITIGRVDVRAIMPSGPPRAATSPRPRPTLSLESYLKQREEGKR